jgi:hypothetical protein
MLTASRFVAEQLGLLPFPPSEARERVRTAHDPACWLCGGETGGSGWDRRDSFPETFTNVTLAAAPASFTVCEACAAVSRRETWERYVAMRPDLGLIAKHPFSFRSYAHAIWTGHHECPRPARWRELLLNPPEPPFVFAIPTSKQKHLLFRCAVARDRERFPVQFEEDRLWLDRRLFGRCLDAAEQLLAAGARRREIEQGRYHQETLRRIGIATWRALEDRARQWRQGEPGWWQLAVLVARGPGQEQEAGTSEEGA